MTRGERPRDRVDRDLTRISERVARAAESATALRATNGRGQPVVPVPATSIGHTGAVDEQTLRQHATEVLRAAGAAFAFVHGSRATATATSSSDLDVAAWWPSQPPVATDVLFEGPVDLLVLDDAPLELAGRVAMWGELLFDDDPPARVRWVADTRKVYLDELPRMRQYEHDLRDALAHGR